MFAHRILLMRPALYAPVQVRAFSLARIALEPAKKAAPPLPPPPAKKSVTAVKVTTLASKKAAPAKLPPALTKRAIDKDKAVAAKERKRAQTAVDKAKATERAAKEKARAKEKQAKAKEKEREKRERLKEREKAKKERQKEREKLKAARTKALEKPYPPPPKRPVSGYVLFAHDPNVKRQKGESITEDAMLAGAAWKALSDAEREAYNKKSEKAREKWKQDVTKWVSSLNLAQLTAARNNREPGTRDGSAMETLPKRPANAYAMFLADVTSRQDFRDKVESLAQKQAGSEDVNQLKKTRIGLFGRTSADIWKTMSDKEKAVYVSKYEDAKKQWDKNFGTLIATQKEAIASALL